MMLASAGAAWQPEEGEEVKVARRVQLVIGDALPGIMGLLSVTTRRVAFRRVAFRRTPVVLAAADTTWHAKVRMRR